MLIVRLRASNRPFLIFPPMLLSMSTEPRVPRRAAANDAALNAFCVSAEPLFSQITSGYILLLHFFLGGCQLQSESRSIAALLRSSIGLLFGQASL